MKEYTLEETQQIIRENQYAIVWLTPSGLYNPHPDIMDILESTDDTRTFLIRTEVNTEDYTDDPDDIVIEYYIKEKR